jgi:hypothetical protein
MQLMAKLKTDIAEDVLTWDLSAFTSQKANGSNEILSGWTAFISRASGDTGLVEQNFLSDFNLFSSQLTPEGM